jgi:ABC-type multidrug transport system ATPase subunit
VYVGVFLLVMSSPFLYLVKKCFRFEWGKLGAIIGADGSGKSSLLSVLGGQYVGTTCMISGQVYYNNNLLSENQLLPWQRCAYVESLDEHFRDLTVKEILDYAMQLRCLEVGELKSVDINVSRTLDLLQLTE